LIKDYYTITKPGIVYGNAITLLAGFLLASKGDIDYLLLIASCMGLSLVIASGCVLNNYIDSDIDALMERTKKRAMVTHVISPTYALVYGVVLGVFGFLILGFFTNSMTVLAASIGFFVYVVVYSLWIKRISTHSSILGSISGAIPPVVGYLAVTGSFDIAACVLFLVLVAWQMTHSFAIAIYRLRDYTRADIMILPVKKGVYKTKVQMLLYAILFFVATGSLYVFGYAGLLYLVSMVVSGVLWIGLCVKGLLLGDKDNEAWARKVFLFSIILLLIFCVSIGIESFIR
jgi:protoheme IX farnesyltransferase